MALTPPSLYADLATARASGGFPFMGVNFDRVAWAIAYSIPPWVQAGGVSLQGLAVGTAGVGAINSLGSKLILPPNPLLVIQGLSSAGMVGPLSTSLGTVVGLALPKTVSALGQYTGGVAGVGVGVDVTKAVAASASALTVLLITNLMGMVGPGPANAQMAAGLGQGISALFLTVRGTGSVVGPPSPVPASGQSTSVVV